jgi:ketosteroid isomerase-like protein
MSRFPGAGNWRYLADYSISATLAYPEKAEYDQDRNTFAVYRNIYRITDDGTAYAFTSRVVISASDGKIITAHPQSKPV